MGDNLLVSGNGLVGSLMLPFERPLAMSGMNSANVGLMRSGREMPVTSEEGVLTRDRKVLPVLGLKSKHFTIIQR